MRYHVQRVTSECYAPSCTEGYIGVLCAILYRGLHRSAMRHPVQRVISECYVLSCINDYIGVKNIFKRTLTRIDLALTTHH